MINLRHTQMSLSEDVFDVTLLEKRPGFISALISGEKAFETFKNEPGGHRWQRIPPTEKRSRVHTSTITVAVLDPSAKIDIDMDDVEVRVQRGSGPGGQHRNKTESCVTVLHRPTGISARIDERSQHRSREIAFKVLRGRLDNLAQQQLVTNRAQERKKQKGSGMRGDKVRTYRVRDNLINDHVSGQKWSFKSWMKGDWK